MDPISIGLAAGGLITNFIGQQSAAKQMREANALVNKQIADLTAWKDTETNRPYLDTNAGRNVMTRATDIYRNQAKNARSTAAVTGASDEAALAQQSASQEALGNVLSNTAAQGVAREDQINNVYRSNLANLMAQKVGLIQGKAQSGANLASSAGSFLQGIGPSLLTGKSAPELPKGIDPFTGRSAAQDIMVNQIAKSA